MNPSLFASRKECSALGLVTLAAVMFLPLIHAGAAGAAPQGGIFYSVNTTSDTVVIGACQNGNPGCSLRGAIQTANSHPGVDGIGIDLPGRLGHQPYWSAAQHNRKRQCLWPRREHGDGAT